VHIYDEILTKSTGIAFFGVFAFTVSNLALPMLIYHNFFNNQYKTKMIENDMSYDMISLLNNNNNNNNKGTNTVITKLTALGPKVWSSRRSSRYRCAPCKPIQCLKQ
jgi:hypothetical protein